MFTVQMCPEKKTTFLLRILKSKLENVVCLAQMIERCVSAGAKLKVCLEANRLGLQPGKQQPHRDGQDRLICANRGTLKNAHTW